MNNYKCIDSKNYALTIDKEYTPIKSNDEFLWLNNDNNKTVKYSLLLFKELIAIELVEELIPEPVVVKTIEDVIASIIFQDYGGMIKFYDLENKVHTFNVKLVESGSDISCGIGHVTEINSTIERIIEYTHDLEQLSDIEIERLNKELLKACLSGFIENLNYAFVLMSTNLNGESAVHEYFFDLLDEISHFKSDEVINPNSNNTIKMWGFYIEQ